MVEISGYALFSATMPVLAIMAIGWLFRKKKWVGEEVQFGLMRLVIWIFTPALIIDRVLFNPLIKNFSDVSTVLIAGFASVAVGILVSAGVARFFEIDSRERRRVFGYTTGIYNYGYIALPICMTLCPPDTSGMMLLFNSGIEVSVWTIGVSFLLGAFRPKQLLKAFVNPIFITMVLTLVLKLTGLNEYVPTWIANPDPALPSLSKQLGACMIPSGILLVGMSLPVLLSGFRWFDDWKISAGAILMRLIVVPALMLLAALFVPAIPQDLRYILIIQSAMPPAMLPIVIVQFYQGDAKLALRVVMVGTLACFVTLPFWIKFGFWALAKISA